MEKQMNVGDKNAQQIGQNPIGQQIQIPKRPKINYWVVSTLVLVILLVLGATGRNYYLYKISKVQNSRQTSSAPTGITPPISRTNTQTFSKKWYFQKKINSDVETIFTLPDLYNNQIVRWNDYLFYGSGEYTSNVQVFSYNLKAGELQTIYDQGSRNDLGQGRNNRYVSDMQILNDTLFFSIGGYLTSGATYYLSLPPMGQTQKLANSTNGKIEFIKGRYWIVSGEGDACLGFRHYSLLDLVTKKVTEIADSVTGCIEGEEYISIDKRDRMILAFHTAETGEGGDEGNGIYQYVIAVPIANPNMKEGVIAKQNMPAGITAMNYLEDTDQLVLYGKESYVFDLSSQALTKTNAPPKPTPLVVQQSSDKTFSDNVRALNLPDEYEFVFQ